MDTFIKILAGCWLTTSSMWFMGMCRWTSRLWLLSVIVRRRMSFNVF